MTMWEYKVIEREGDNFDLESQLDKEGASWWELVCANSNLTLFVMKRAKK